MFFQKSNFIDAYRIATSPLRSIMMHHRRRAGTVPVFIVFYHRIADQHLNDWTMTNDQFTQQINWFQERFDLVDLAECQRRIASGRNTRPTLSITFDDGYAENCEHALPMLLERKIPVTYFVAGQTHDQQPFPHDVASGAPLAPNTMESILAMTSAGIEIGAHTRTHADLGNLTDPEQIVDEVLTATRDLEALINQPIRYFAFPFGQFENLNDDVFHMLRRAGIEGVCSAYGGWNTIGGDAFHLQRVHGDPDFSRMKNWLSFDPRIAHQPRYDYCTRTRKVWIDRDRNAAADETANHTPQIDIA